MRFATAFATLALSLAPIEAWAEWRSLRSEHFHLIGDASSRQLRDVALRFEQFRDIVTRLNIASARQQPVAPLTIFVFKDRRSFEPFMPRSDGRTVEAAGMFVEGPDNVYIAVRLDRGEEAFRSVFHEYTHLLLRRVFPEAPLWLHEGLAEYYSTLRITGDRTALIGYPVVQHVRLLQQQSMPLTQMFAATDRSPEYIGETAARLLLYAQSWALVHHAFQSRPPYEDAMLELAKTLIAGGAVDESVRKHYGMSLADLELRVLGYIRSGKYTAVGVRFRDDLVRFVTNDASIVSDGEADGWLGDLLSQMLRDDEARLRLESALQRQPQLAQAHQALGLLLLRKDRTNEAATHLGRAKELGADVDELLKKANRVTAAPAGFTQSPSTGQPAPRPSGARPSLRITLAGEERSFGTLEALDCKGDQVEFVIRTANGIVRAGGRFAEISVTNYRPSSLGNLLCGPQPSKLLALLTWRAAGDARLAVAVEFVPDGFVP